MNTYIVTYAPLEGDAYSRQNIRLAKITSEIDDKELIKSAFEERCNIASADIKTYEGMHVYVETLEEFLNSLPSDTI